MERRPEKFSRQRAEEFPLHTAKPYAETFQWSHFILTQTPDGKVPVFLHFPANHLNLEATCLDAYHYKVGEPWVKTRPPDSQTTSLLLQAEQFYVLADLQHLPAFSKQGLDNDTRKKHLWSLPHPSHSNLMCPWPDKMLWALGCLEMQLFSSFSWTLHGMTPRLGGEWWLLINNWARSFVVMMGQRWIIKA